MELNMLIGYPQIRRPRIGIAEDYLGPHWATVPFKIHRQYRGLTPEYPEKRHGIGKILPIYPGNPVSAP
jgi:hypothetical protein